MIHHQITVLILVAVLIAACASMPTSTPSPTPMPTAVPPTLTALPATPTNSPPTITPTTVPPTPIELSATAANPPPATVLPAEKAETDTTKDNSIVMETNRMNIEIGEKVLTATLVENSSVDA